MPNGSNNKINLILIIHCHQPVGNFDGVFEEAYNKSYLSFVQVLEKHPKIKAALHYSGCLLDWIKEKRPEFLDILKRLVKKGQVEMVSGGYYEPILPLIPDRDKLGQIKMHSDFIRQHTGFEPKGIWLAERVWEPYLARIFSQAGLKYTLVDDSHFELAGKKADEILGYYLTEEEGHTVAIFPSSKKLRYNLPFKLASETINYLRSQATPDGSRVVTFGDDGEKFGLWPKTYKWVYEEGWLESFFKALEDNSDWINVLWPSEYMEKYAPMGRIYLPCASYPEMLEWSGGYFRNFLVKYPEANWMQKRMFYISDKVADSGSKKPLAALYRAQCNCAYWHGVFGGLYLHHLRAAVYRNLIEADKILAGLEKSKSPLKVNIKDIDKDGTDDVIAENGSLAVCINPREGGSVAEIDYWDKSLNLVNTLARRPEAYHKKLQGLNSGASAPVKTNGIASIHDAINVKEKNLNELLNYDWHRKTCFLDHFFSSGANASDFSKVKFADLGGFAVRPYKCEVTKSSAGITVLLESATADIQVEKAIKIEPKKTALSVSYKIRNISARKADLWFGSESNFSLWDKALVRPGESAAADSFKVRDEWFGVLLEYSFDKAAGAWFYPIETVSDSEGGLERTFQGLCLLFHWRFSLDPKQAWGGNISLGIK
ncbi:MAG: DUF1926 domain-containing protein [Candidatus Omnitrophica bacterium]|nr:DUF1926 domain-containing protein [Candidatus Omnitrophota bacterium]